MAITSVAPMVAVTPTAPQALKTDPKDKGKKDDDVPTKEQENQMIEAFAANYIGEMMQNSKAEAQKLDEAGKHDSSPWGDI